MQVLFEFIKFFGYSLLIVLISKYILVKLLRKLAENLDLKAKTIGNIAGIATSIPELLSVSFAALSGLISTSLYNILSSNIINTIQYGLAIKLNNNEGKLKNKALKIDLFLVAATIVIPILLLVLKIELNILILPVFLLLFLLFYFININCHKLYLQSVTKNMENKELIKIEQEKKWIRGKNSLTVMYSVLLIITAIVLFIIGNLLSNTLESLCLEYSIPEIIVGILLGGITSLPELITFFESQRHYKNDNNIEGVVEATNNLLTSNLLNLFFIQSIGILLFWWS